MKEGWKEFKLGEIFEINRGGSPRPISDFLTNDPNGVNWIKIGDAKINSKYIYSTEEKIRPEGILKSRKVQVGDFILSNSMSFGRPYIMKTDGCIHDGWLVLHEIGHVVNQDYLYYVLSSDYVFQQFDKLAAGSTVRNLNTNLVKGVTIPVPPLDEQQRIVAKLDEAFAAIDQAKINTERNLENVKELFDVFLEKVIITNEGQEITLGEIASIKGGKRVPKGSKLQTTPTQHPYIRVSDFKDDGTIETSGVQYISDQVYKQIQNYTITINDVYISIAGTIGKTGIIPIELNNANLTENACKLVFKMPVVPRYIYYFTKTRKFMEQAVGNTRVTAMPKLALSRISTIKLKLPFDIEKQTEIVNDIDNLQIEKRKIERNYQMKLANLEVLRKTILQKAFNGEL
ncbi:MAG: restriction endonuclease subunit S [Anaerolineaceae bacterium]|nr:restriction endonuclease subunit S [Anaerolineaceae bacterium]